MAEIAAGTAAGGPWGAIISAAWAMRHTLFKILVCLCLSVVFLIVMIVELPGIIINKALGLDGNEPTVSITEIYENLSETVSDIVQAGYDASMAEVERLISDGGYDRELSMNALINYAQSSAGYDTAYILSAYSTSMEQLNLIVGNTTHNKVIIGRIFSAATVQNEIQPLFGIRIEFQRFQFSFPPFIIFIPGDNTIFPTAFELTTPLRRLFIQRRDIEATPEVYIGAGMNQIRLCNF